MDCLSYSQQVQATVLKYGWAYIESDSCYKYESHFSTGFREAKRPSVLQSYAQLGQDQRIHLIQMQVLKLTLAQINNESSLSARREDLLAFMGIASILSRRCFKCLILKQQLPL